MGYHSTDDDEHGTETKSRHQLIIKAEHPLLYWYGYLYIALPFLVLMPLSLLWPLLPNDWLTLGWIQELDALLRLSSKKLKFEAGLYDLNWPLKGTSYVLFVAVCGLMLVLTNLFLAIPATILTWRYGQPIRREQRMSYWFLPLMFVVISYLALFYQFDDGSERRSYLAKFYFGTWLVFPVTAALWSALSAMIGNLLVLITKVLRHRSL